MGNRNLFNKVIEHLNDAQQLLKIGVEKGKLSTIERDILLEKLRASYENLLFDKDFEPQLIEKKEDATPKHEQLVVKSTKEVVIPSEKEDLPKHTNSDEKYNDSFLENNEAETISLEEHNTHSETTENDIVMEEDHYIEQDNDQQIETSEKMHTETLGEKYQGKKKFRNEVLSAGKKDMASILQNKPITDLTKAIGINDKFLFTKELFSGNAELYAKTIRKLNDFTDINDALFFIQDNFSWDDKNEAANQLIDLVRRKLMIG